MKIINIGSLNIDYVYTVAHAVCPGETIAAKKLEKHCGGKGLNQSVALAKAGAEIYHAGKIGEDGQMLLSLLKKYGVNTEYVFIQNKIPTGHAVIQVDSTGQNCIVVYGGANADISKEEIDSILEHFDKEDILLVQNEVSNIDYAIVKAKEKNMTVILNPSPTENIIFSKSLSCVDWFLLNELEGYEMTGETEAEKICDCLLAKYPNCHVVLTLGENGSLYYDGRKKIKQGIIKVRTVDTTAAGDTFTGFLLAGLTRNIEIEEILRYAARASAITVSRVGAAESIPYWDEIISIEE